MLPVIDFLRSRERRGENGAIDTALRRASNCAIFCSECSNYRHGRVLGCSRCLLEASATTVRPVDKVWCKGHARRVASSGHGASMRLQIGRRSPVNCNRHNGAVTKPRSLMRGEMCLPRGQMLPSACARCAKWKRNSLHDYKGLDCASPIVGGGISPAHIKTRICTWCLAAFISFRLGMSLDFLVLH